MTAPSVPRRKPLVLAAVASVVVALIVVAFVVLQPPRTVAVREEASPNPASPGQTVIFRYFLRNGLAVAVTVDRIHTSLYHNDTFFVAVNITSSNPGWLASTVPPQQEVQILEGSFLVSAEFIGRWFERATFFTSAGAFISETSYTFTSGTSYTFSP